MITLGRSSRQGDVSGTVPRSRKQINPRLPFLQLKRTISVAVSNASNAIHLRDNSPSQSSRFLWHVLDWNEKNRADSSKLPKISKRQYSIFYMSQFWLLERVSRLCVLVFALLFVFLHEFVIVFWTGWLNGILLTGGNPVRHPRQAPRYLPPSQSVAPTIRTCVCICNLFCICICISNLSRSTRMPPTVTISRTIRRATFTRPSSSRWDLQY